MIMENQMNDYISSTLGKLELVSSVLYGLKCALSEEDATLSSTLNECSSVVGTAKRDIEAYIDQLLNPTNYVD